MKFEQHAKIFGSVQRYSATTKFKLCVPVGYAVTSKNFLDIERTFSTLYVSNMGIAAPNFVFRMTDHDIGPRYLGSLRNPETI